MLLTWKVPAIEVRPLSALLVAVSEALAIWARDESTSSDPPLAIVVIWPLPNESSALPWSVTPVVIVAGPAPAMTSFAMLVALPEREMPPVPDSPVAVTVVSWFKSTEPMLR